MPPPSAAIDADRARPRKPAEVISVGATGKSALARAAGWTPWSEYGAMAVMNAELITTSLDLVAERCADPTFLVYQRLFAREPEMEALFVRDTDASVRGQMLYQVIETMLDFVGRRHFAVGMIRSEVVNHENLGVPPQVFASFFATVAETFRDILGEAWTPAMEAAWAELLSALRAEAAPSPG